MIIDSIETNCVDYVSGSTASYTLNWINNSLNELISYYKENMNI